jgi:FtsZ-binding cell division protein ZapB
MNEVFEGNIYEDGQQFKDDDKLLVRFFMRTIEHKFNSQREGRPMFVEIPYIEILTPGSRDTLVTEATEHYQNRFRRQWENFKAREEAPMEGTPLAEVPWMSRSQVAELGALNIKTIEQLINIPDSLSQRIMGFSQLRERMQRFLAASQGESVTGKLDMEIAELKLRNTELTEKVQNLMARLEELMKPKAKAV